MFDLQRLVHPVPLGVFFAEHWDKKPLLVKRGDRRYFHELFSVDDLDPFLSNFGSPAPFKLRLAKEDGDPPSIEFEANVPLDLDRIYAGYRDGYTVNVNDIACHHPAVRRMTHALLAELGARPRPNVYLTPAGSRAFDLHYDTHDVIILQLGGAKEWRVYQRVDETPTPAHSVGTNIDRARVAAPAIETTLEAGELLYVPRGFVHEAHTEDRFSLHITVGVLMHTYLDVLGKMVEAAGFRSAKLRESLPPGAVLGRSRAEVIARLLEMLGSELGESLVDEALASWAINELAQSAPVDRPRFADLDGPEGAPITLDEPLTRPAALVTTLRAGGGRVRLHFQAGALEGPWRVRPALEYVMRTETLRARDLPGTLTDDEKLVLARRMVRDGVLLRSGRRDAP
ncbi:MAG: hypothetical protein KIT84_05710 [Labilithrix sp.]|nr:hypothetical protein [Labilithrix sp.]MCW5810485.1 hypothetical protein [Labilithrix sp.]